jgi:hypothetical protein
MTGYQNLYRSCSDLSTRIGTAMPRSIPARTATAQDKARLRCLFRYLVEEATEQECATFATALQTYRAVCDARQGALAL